MGVFVRLDLRHLGWESELSYLTQLGTDILPLPRLACPVSQGWFGGLPKHPNQLQSPVTPGFTP